MSENLFAKHVQRALEWVNQINDLLKWDQRAYALDALRAVLHQLRDNLTVIEAVHLGAQFPLIIRGIYFEGWRPSDVPLKERDREIFIQSVRENLEQDIKRSFEDMNIEEVIQAVFQTLADRIDEGEISKLHNILPSGLKSFAKEAMVISYQPAVIL